MVALKQRPSPTIRRSSQPIGLLSDCFITMFRRGMGYILVRLRYTLGTVSGAQTQPQIGMVVRKREIQTDACIFKLATLPRCRFDLKPSWSHSFSAQDRPRSRSKSDTVVRVPHLAGAAQEVLCLCPNPILSALCECTCGDALEFDSGRLH